MSALQKYSKSSIIKESKSKAGARHGEATNIHGYRVREPEKDDEAGRVSQKDG